MTGCIYSLYTGHHQWLGDAHVFCLSTNHRISSLLLSLQIALGNRAHSDNALVKPALLIASSTGVRWKSSASHVLIYELKANLPCSIIHIKSFRLSHVFPIVRLKRQNRICYTRNMCFCQIFNCFTHSVFVKIPCCLITNSSRIKI